MGVLEHEKPSFVAREAALEGATTDNAAVIAALVYVGDAVTGVAHMLDQLDTTLNNRLVDIEGAM
jgi:hypothetical protein